MDLLKKKCVPCEGGVSPLTSEQIQTYLKELKTPWEVLADKGSPRSRGVKKIRRAFVLKGFREAIAFVNKVAHIAEAEDHHPDIHIHYRRVVLELWTHAIGGLSENDFIVAAKVETLL